MSLDDHKEKIRRSSNGLNQARLHQCCQSKSTLSSQHSV